MQKRCPNSQPRFIATLHNYRLAFVGWSRKWRGGIATIKSFRGGKVKGGIYEVSEADLRQLDKFEGINYQRLKVIVNNEDREPVEAVTYIYTPQIEETKPSPEYVTIMRQGYMDWRLI
jgi:gamma-glutamylcyclotransferase (GGCT)/AIG2-like uncharacterized protein YtfP